MLPSSAPIFQMVSRGNIEEVQLLFSTGQASPFVRNSSGWTLLDVGDFLMTKFRLEFKLILLRWQHGVEIWNFADY